jgi:hypothetical protein
VVDKWAKKGQESIQDATDKAFMEAPAYLSRIVGDRLSSIFSGKLGTDIGNKTGGTCRVITKDEDCKTGEGEIIREKDGKQEFARINLSGNTVFQSPYFQLKQNDIVYVDINNRKVPNADQASTRNISLIIGITSSLGILLTAINALTK